MNPPGQRYNKPALDENELIERYIERGLIITDRNRAARYLRHIGYYRLSPYTIPFQADRTTHSFKSGTTFDDILYIYVFDRQLRLLTMDALERVEVLVERERQRTPSDRGEQADHLHYPDALSHYLATYSSPETPPSWLVIELLTAGELHHLYTNLTLRYRKTIARELNLPDQVLQSWLKTYVRVRNICAHHGRLWNRFLGVYPAIPRSPTVRWLTDRSIFDTGNPGALERKRLHPVLVSLQSILFTISPQSTWTLRLHALLEKYQRIPLNALGMKANRDADEFWQEAFKAGTEPRFSPDQYGQQVD